MDWMALIAIIASLLFIGFFAGIEIAFVSANKLSVELNRKQGTISGMIWGRFSDNPARFIGTTLVCINVVFVIYGLLIGKMLSPVWDWISSKLPHSWDGFVGYIRLFVETIISTIIVLFVEFMAKAFFRARNNSVISSDTISYVVKFFYWLFSSLATLFVDLAEWALKYIFNVKLNKKKEVFGKVDLEHFIQQSKSHEEEDTSEINKELFENALSLSEIKLRECLVPRREIEGVDSLTSILEVKA